VGSGGKYTYRVGYWLGPQEFEARYHLGAWHSAWRIGHRVKSEEKEDFFYAMRFAFLLKLNMINKKPTDKNSYFQDTDDLWMHYSH
jgi:hypothetical protein